MPQLEAMTLGALLTAPLCWVLETAGPDAHLLPSRKLLSFDVLGGELPALAHLAVATGFDDSAR